MSHCVCVCEEGGGGAGVGTNMLEKNYDSVTILPLNGNITLDQNNGNKLKKKMD